MSNLTAIELGISEERQNLLNERARQLMKSNPDLTDFLLELDRQKDLSSLEKIAISCTVALYVVSRGGIQAKPGDRKVPLTSNS